MVFQSVHGKQLLRKSYAWISVFTLKLIFYSCLLMNFFKLLNYICLSSLEHSNTDFDILSGCYYDDVKVQSGLEL